MEPSLTRRLTLATTIRSAIATNDIRERGSLPAAGIPREAARYPLVTRDAEWAQLCGTLPCGAYRKDARSEIGASHQESRPTAASAGTHDSPPASTGAALLGACSPPAVIALVATPYRPGRSCWRRRDRCGPGRRHRAGTIAFLAATLAIIDSADASVQRQARATGSRG